MQRGTIPLIWSYLWEFKPSHYLGLLIFSYHKILLQWLHTPVYCRKWRCWFHSRTLRRNSSAMGETARCFRKTVNQILMNKHWDMLHIMLGKKYFFVSICFRLLLYTVVKEYRWCIYIRIYMSFGAVKVENLTWQSEILCICESETYCWHIEHPTQTTTDRQTHMFHTLTLIPHLIFFPALEEAKVCRTDWQERIASVRNWIVLCGGVWAAWWFSPCFNMPFSLSLSSFSSPPLWPCLSAVYLHTCLPTTTLFDCYVLLLSA